MLVIVDIDYLQMVQKLTVLREDYLNYLIQLFFNYSLYLINETHYIFGFKINLKVSFGVESSKILFELVSI